MAKRLTSACELRTRKCYEMVHITDEVERIARESGVKTESASPSK